jgi:hypothetical protein
MALYNSSTNMSTSTTSNKRIFAPGGTNDSQQAQQYTKGSLDATQLDPNPLTQFDTSPKPSPSVPPNCLQEE